MANGRLIFHTLILFSGIQASAFLPAFTQTCCSGGVPLSGNIGFEGAARGTLQMELSYDLNYLSTLKTGSEVYEDGSRRRTTQSLLLKSGYSLSDWFALDALFSYVFQERKINYNQETNRVFTNGLGDAVLMAKFILLNMSKSGSELQLGMGPKLPLGRSDLTNKQGITLNADLQPGSGSWDVITWGYFARQLNPRPTMVASLRIVGRFNGKNNNYLGSLSYKFGNSIPLYSQVGGTQLTPTFRLQIGFYHSFGKITKVKSKDVYDEI